MKSVVSRVTVSLLLYACFTATMTGQQPPRAAGALRIVVIEGEDAVNVIQQKTAVAPVVEVRDQNGLPVPGAVVRFTIGGGNASFTGGSQTLTITTNAAGRAAASAVNPLASGSVQIQVQATFQGQSAAATIAQTNVATAAQASGTAASAGGGGAGAGGGGVNGLAIAGIAGGVGAGAAVVAVQKGNADEDADAAIDPAVQAASGRYVLQQINGVGLPAVSVPSPPNSCPVVTDNATLTLTARPQVFELNENSRNDCRIGANMSFQASFAGTWSLQGASVTIIPSSTTTSVDFGAGALTGSTLTILWGPPHVETGKQTARLNTVWVK